ncbi:hypothetical protein C8R48DRAFT_601850 [Suillus tomentosus]|nr:hypothetical protein C8R48DRAFT_601850 [Suillus tomentosus]
MSYDVCFPYLSLVCPIFTCSSCLAVCNSELVHYSPFLDSLRFISTGQVLSRSLQVLANHLYSHFAVRQHSSNIADVCPNSLDFSIIINSKTIAQELLEKCSVNYFTHPVIRTTEMYVLLVFI